MSNHLPHALTACLVVAWLSGSAQTAQSEGLDPIEAWAESVTRPGPWRGPITPYPDPEPRPELPLRVCSTLVPLCAHADESVPAAQLERVLSAFEDALAWLRARDVALPFPDGGAGGTLELDVYLDGHSKEPVRVALDGPLDRSLTLGLDGSHVHMHLWAGLAESQLASCAVQALTLAGLRAHDPAEAAEVLAGIAAFESSLAEDRDECVPGALDQAQAAPELGVVGDRNAEGPDAARAATLALALTFASRRHDGGTGRFVREVYQLARQQSATTDVLRASPSFFEALDRALRNAGESLDALMEELAIERYLGAIDSRSALPWLASAVAPTAVVTPPFDALPAHLPPHEPALLPYGSAYAEVPVPNAPEGARLDVWLRGELGARYSLCALRLDRQRREIGRLCAPARKVPDSFLPVELEPGTQAVLLVVTRMPASMRELSWPTTPHAFRLIVKQTQ